MKLIGMVVLVSGLVIATAEVFFRLEPKLRRSTGVGVASESTLLSVPTEFAPYTDGFNVKGWRAKNLNTNAHGFRTLRELGDKAPTEKRIFILGGSAAIGWGASHDDTTFAIKLEKQLTENTPGVGVFNAGCDGFNSNQEWVLMATQIMDLKPDLILLFDGYNDLHYSMGENWTPEYNIYSPQVRDKLNFHAWYLHSALLKFLSTRTARLRAPSTNLARTGVLRTDAVDRYVANVKKIAWASDRVGAKTLVVLQPHFLVSGKPLTESEKRTLDIGHDYKMFTNYAEVIGPLYSMAHATLVNAASTDVTFANANDWFRERRENLFLDEVHMTDEGHALIADRLSAVIRRENLLGDDRGGPRQITTTQLKTGNPPNDPSVKIE